MSLNLNEEIVILNEIHHLSKNIDTIIHSIQNEKKRLMEKMDNVNNTYFDKNPTIKKKFNELLNNNLLNNMTQNMQELNKIANKSILESCCEHNYLVYPDNDATTSNKIVYCSLCNISLKKK